MTISETFDIEAPAGMGGTRHHLIGGAWVPSRSGETIATFNPATGGELAQLARGGTAEIDMAVAAARRAFEGPWSRSTPHERQVLLLRVHDLIMAHYDELSLIETLDMGAPLRRTRSLRNYVSQVLLFFTTQTGLAGSETTQNSLSGDVVSMKLLAPVGVVGGIIPWNAPLMSQWWVIGSALATGCTAVIKPAEDASLTVLRVAELLLEAGVPEGVINVVTGYGHEAGAALAEHMDVDRIAFTGSVETARKIVSASAGNMKRLQLELGGKSPDVIFADADLDKAVPGAGMAVYANSGQVCTAGTRIFVQRAIQDEFVARLQDFCGGLRVGNGLDPEVDLGPLINGKQLERVMSYMDIGQGEGARLVAGGTRLGGDLADGYFVAPTIFSDVRNDMRIAREEIFGPVASVIPFDTEEEALRLANDTAYGLAGAVWTQNLGTAHRMVRGIRSGMVWVNTYGAFDPAVGFGAYKASGYGWKGGPEQIRGFLYEKAVYMNIA